jgi:hypothetical protein
MDKTMLRPINAVRTVVAFIIVTDHLA